MTLTAQQHVSCHDMWPIPTAWEIEAEVQNQMLHRDRACFFSFVPLPSLKSSWWIPVFYLSISFFRFSFFLAIFTLQDSVNRKISKLGLLCTYDSFHQYGAYLGGRLDL